MRMVVHGPRTASSQRRRVLRAIAPVGVALALGAATGLAVGVGAAFLVDPPNSPPNVGRSFMLDGRAWSIVETSRFAVRRAIWSEITDESMNPPQARPLARRIGAALGLSRPPRPEPEKPEVLLQKFRDEYEPLLLARPRSAVRREPAFWGQFATGHAPARGEHGSDVGIGWPWVCAWYQVVGRVRGLTSTGAEVRGGHVLRGTPSPVGDSPGRVLPLRPAWQGLIGNTLVFALAWQALLLAVPAARSALRRRRGLCPACAYDLRGTPAGSPCPECGAPRHGQPANHAER